MSGVKVEEHLLVWNSAFRNNMASNNANCLVSYKNHNWLANTINFRVKSITLTHLFPNIYGGARTLYTDILGTTTLFTIPEGNYATAADIFAPLIILLEAALGPAVTMVVDANNFATITSTAPFTILSPEAVRNLTGLSVSLNEVLGQVDDSTTTPYTFVNPVNLTGPRKVRINSSTIGSGHSIHPNGDVGDIMSCISLHDVEYGSSKMFELENSENSRSHFRDARDCNSISLHLTDEYNQQLTLPSNAHVDVVFIVSSLTGG